MMNRTLAVLLVAGAAAHAQQPFLTDDADTAQARHFHVEILSEYDDRGWERRKVESCRDGSVHFASGTESVGGCDLSLIPRRPDEEVVDEPEFRVFEMTEGEFEQAWKLARTMSNVA